MLPCSIAHLVKWANKQGSCLAARPGHAYRSSYSGDNDVRSCRSQGRWQRRTPQLSLLISAPVQYDYRNRRLRKGKRNMAKAKSKTNRSQMIRDILAINPHMPAKEVVAEIAAKGHK